MRVSFDDMILDLYKNTGRHVGILDKYNAEIGSGEILSLTDGDCYYIQKEEAEKLKISSKDIGFYFTFAVANQRTCAVDLRKMENFG